jgi:hypothetical protein
VNAIQQPLPVLCLIHLAAAGHAESNHPLDHGKEVLDAMMQFVTEHPLAAGFAFLAIEQYKHQIETAIDEVDQRDADQRIGYVGHNCQPVRDRDEPQPLRDAVECGGKYPGGKAAEQGRGDDSRIEGNEGRAFIVALAVPLGQKAGRRAARGDQIRGIGMLAEPFAGQQKPNGGGVLAFQVEPLHLNFLLGAKGCATGFGRAAAVAGHTFTRRHQLRPKQLVPEPEMPVRKGLAADIDVGASICREEAQRFKMSRWR